MVGNGLVHRNGHRPLLRPIEFNVLLAILREKIHDNRFLRLIREPVEGRVFGALAVHATLSGVPQGATCSPVLSNVYLDRLDRFIEAELLPAYTRGKTRRWNKRYKALMNKVDRARRQGRHDEARALLKGAQRLPSHDTHDPTYRRLRYVRYADLCRCPHKSAYAECRVMPTPVGKGLTGQRDSGAQSA